MTAKSSQSGRSMIEMLGVLAIVGILSVTGINSFSKAMTKHKLNKQTEQLSELFNTITIYAKSFIGDGEARDFIPILQTMDEIPNGMIIKENRLFDDFGNQIYIGSNNCSETKGCNEAKISYSLNKGAIFPICQNLLNTAVLFANDMLYLTVAFTTQEKPDNTQYVHQYYGNKHQTCGNGGKCIKDIKIEKMIEMCETCQDKKGCYFVFLWSNR